MSFKLAPIHPFPARMASELVFEHLAGLGAQQVVLDPMSGSGTVLRAASEMGHSSIGFDVDPLAVLMARVWTTPINAVELDSFARNVVAEARGLSDPSLPWVARCPETQKYIDFWFRPEQAKQLRKLAFVLANRNGPQVDALRIALSRTIITKERGASIARDTSHSRPHRVFLDNDYNVFDGFLQSTKQLVTKLYTHKLRGVTVVNVGDVRQMQHLPNGVVDVIITSPPYINAIDYLRGHRLALVWLGFSVTELRHVRASAIGTEMSQSSLADRYTDQLLRNAGKIDRLPGRERTMIVKYAIDVRLMMLEMSRVLSSGGELLLVIGNSCLKGISISNAAIHIAAAESVGLRLHISAERALPPRNRYLPPPSQDEDLALAKRMRTETVLAFSA